MRLAKVALLLVFLISALAFAAPYFISVDAVKSKFIENFEKETSQKISVEGGASFGLLPSPTIDLQQVKIHISEDEILDINNVELGVSWGALFGGIPEIKSVSIANSSLNFADVQNFYKSLANKTANSTSISNIGLKKTSIIINPQSDFFGVINVQDGEISYIPGKYLKTSIVCDSDGVNYTIDANLADDGSNADSSYAEIKTGYGMLEFKGQADLKSKQVKGKAIVKLFDSSHQIDAQTKVLHSISGSNFSGSADISFQDSQLDFSNMQFSSESISKGIGDMQLNLGYWNELTLNYSIDQVDFDTIIKAQKNQTENSITLDQFLKSLLNSFNLDVPDNITGSVVGNINSILINGQKVENFAVESNLFQGKFILNEFNAVLPGQTTLNIQGTLSHNDVRPKFSGSISINSPNFGQLAPWLHVNEQIVSLYGNNNLSFQADIDLIPRSLRFDSVRIAIGDLRSMGKLAIKHYGESKLYVSSSMRYNKIDMDALKWTDSIENYLQDLYVKDYLKDQNTILEASNDFAWLRDFPVNLSMDIDVDNLIYRGNLYQKASLESTVNSNMLHIEKFNLGSTDGAAHGEIKFTISGIDPKVEGNITFDRLTEKFLPKLLPANDMLNKAKYDTLKAANISTKEVDPDYLSFYSLNGMTVVLDLNVKDYKSSSIKFQNAQAKLISQNGYINLLKLTADAFSGKLTMSGNMSIGSLVTNFNTNFTLNNFEMDELLLPLFGYNKLNGFASISGSLKGKGVKVTDFPHSIAGSFDLLGKKIGWEGFDLGQITGTVDASNKLADKVTNINYYSQNGETVFEDLSGSISVNNGLANLKDFKMTNSRISGAYAANVDIPTSNIASSATFAFIPVSRATPLNISMQSTGTLKNPKTTITMDDVNNYMLSQARIEFQQVEDESTRKLLRNRIVTGGDSTPSTSQTPQTQQPQTQNTPTNQQPADAQATNSKSATPTWSTFAPAQPTKP